MNQSVSPEANKNERIIADCDRYVPVLGTQDGSDLACLESLERNRAVTLSESERKRLDALRKRFQECLQQTQ